MFECGGGGEGKRASKRYFCSVALLAGHLLDTLSLWNGQYWLLGPDNRLAQNKRRQTKSPIS